MVGEQLVMVLRPEPGAERDDGAARRTGRAQPDACCLTNASAATWSGKKIFRAPRRSRSSAMCWPNRFAAGELRSRAAVSSPCERAHSSPS